MDGKKHITYKKIDSLVKVQQYHIKYSTKMHCVCIAKSVRSIKPKRARTQHRTVLWLQFYSFFFQFLFLFFVDMFRVNWAANPSLSFSFFSPSNLFFAFSSRTFFFFTRYVDKFIRTSVKKWAYFFTRRHALFTETSRFRISIF